MAPRYSYLLANTLDGVVFDEVLFSSFAWDDVVSRPGSWSATLGVRNVKARRVNLEPWRVSVYVAAGDQVLFGGPITKLEAGTEGDTVNLGGVGILGYWRDKRLLMNVDGMTYATAPTPADVHFGTDVDLFDIVTDLFDNAAVGGSVPYLGYDFRGPAAAGRSGAFLPEPLELAASDGKTPGGVLEDLADLDDGLDYGLTYGYSLANTIWQDLNLFYPIRGERSGVVLEAGKNVAIIQWSLDGGKLANKVTGYGAGEADAALRTVAEASELIAPAGYWPLLEDVVTDKRRTNAALLQSLTDAELALRRAPAETLSLNVRESADTPIGSFGPGDFVQVAATDGIFELDGYWRVIAISPKIDEDGQASADVDLAAVTHYAAKAEEILNP